MLSVLSVVDVHPLVPLQIVREVGLYTLKRHNTLMSTVIELVDAGGLPPSILEKGEKGCGQPMLAIVELSFDLSDATTFVSTKSTFVCMHRCRSRAGLACLTINAS